MAHRGFLRAPAASGAIADYERDFGAWCAHQAGLLRAGRLQELDLGNLAEEVESMGKRERRSVVSLTQEVLEHLLALQFSPAIEPRRHWEREVRGFRDQIERLLADNASLRAHFDELLEEAWTAAHRRTRADLANEGVSRLPAACPYAAAQVLSHDWWPPHEPGA